MTYSIQERATLLRMYLSHDGDTWANTTGWFGSSDHCTWAGITCAPNLEDKMFRVIEFSLPDNQIAGIFPTELHNFDQLEVFNFTANSLEGIIPDDICAMSTEDLYINADAANCPNEFDGVVGEYLEGCCDEILINVDIYLNYFAYFILGDEDCANLVGTEVSVCEYMKNKDNHDIFATGYPLDFPDVWGWLKVRMKTFLATPL